MRPYEENYSIDGVVFFIYKSTKNSMVRLIDEKVKETILFVLYSITPFQQKNRHTYLYWRNLPLSDRLYIIYSHKPKLLCALMYNMHKIKSIVRHVTKESNNKKSYNYKSKFIDSNCI